MKIIVPIKRVIDPYVNVRVKSDNTGVVTDNVKMSMNPFDEIAIEAAIQLKEQGIATDILAVALGAPVQQEQLRTALALGADRALLIQAEPELLEPLNCAKLLAAVVKQEQPQLVIMGKQAIDDDNNQTGQMLAGLLGWAQGTFVSDISIDGETVHVTREVDAGLETLALQLPAVLTTDLRLNEPRYAALPNIMKAKRKPLAEATPADYGLEFSIAMTTQTVVAPAARQAGEHVTSVTELVAKLAEKQVI